MLRTGTFNGAARAAAALIGIRIAAGRDRRTAMPDSDTHPPDWLWELDEYEEDQELELALHSPLGELMQARLAEPARFSRPPACAAPRLARRNSPRRGTCTTTRR
jgi:hypothetical protein